MKRKYTLSNRKPKSRKKMKSNIKYGRKKVKKAVQGLNDGVDKVLGIPKKDPDFGLVTRSKKRRRR